jgi:hypothetical protein
MKSLQGWKRPFDDPIPPAPRQRARHPRGGRELYPEASQGRAAARETAGRLAPKPRRFPPHGGTRAQGEEMTEQEELIQNIRERLGEMPKGALPFDLVAFATNIGERYTMTQNEIIRLVMNEAEALGVNYLIGSSSR